MTISPGRRLFKINRDKALKFLGVLGAKVRLYLSLL